MSESEAREWAGANCSGDEYEEIFGPVENDDEFEQVSVVQALNVVDALSKIASRNSYRMDSGKSPLKYLSLICHCISGFFQYMVLSFNAFIYDTFANVSCVPRSSRTRVLLRLGRTFCTSGF